MKKILLIGLIALVATSAANAQIAKNSILLGGDVSFGSTKNTTTSSQQTNTNGNIGLSIGKAIKKNTVVGLNIGFSPMKQTNTPIGNDAFTEKGFGYNIGAFYREYKKLAKDFYLFGQLDAGYYSIYRKSDYTINTNNDTKWTSKSGKVSVTPGIAYKLFKKTYVELSVNSILSIQYTNAKNTFYADESKNSKSKSFSIGSGFTSNGALSNIGIGFRFVL